MAGVVDTSKVGSYPITYRIKDRAGNEATVTRIVNVHDEEVPIITLKGDNPLILEAGTSYEELAATAVDNVDGDISEQLKITGEVNVNKLGVYEIRYNVTDSSENKAIEVIREVHVVDATPPKLTLNGASDIEIELGATYTGVQQRQIITTES